MVLAVILVFFAAPLIVIYRYRERRDGFFDWCDWGGKIWYDACGIDIEVRGQENLEEDREYVFVSNHRSYLDTVALYVFVGRRLGLVGKKELLKAPIFGPGMIVANVIAIDRSNPEKARQSMERARGVVADGYSFGVFAEGTRAMPGQLLPFKKGAIHLALQTGIPIVPVAMLNTDTLMGKKQGVVHPGTVQMQILPPIETAGKNAKEDLMSLLIEARTSVARAMGYEGD